MHGDALPEGLMKRLKNGPGSHLKRNYFTYHSHSIAQFLAIMCDSLTMTMNPTH